ncbi:hypothetical protein B0H11DRAFT_2240580 [Mycena galericulata]|nr:hypothetical protein B0H11DRAFT_2240580 [Mycena galericulata]
MALRVKTIDDLCHDRKTKDEAYRLYGTARVNTAAGSGFDLGEDRAALPAVCAYIASQNLNNTDVSIQAAQRASCQTMVKFKKLYGLVSKALEAPKRARREPLTYKVLLEECPQISAPAVVTAAVAWMYKVEVRVLEKLQLEDDENNQSSEDEITCAVFTWVCNLVTRQRLFHAKSFEDKYETDTTNMREVTKIIRTVCGHMEADILRDCDEAAASKKSVSASPRKSPTKPLRALPSRDSPQKRKVADGPSNIPDSPTKKQKGTLITLDAIRATASPTKPAPALSTPRKAQRLHSSSPSKSPTKRSAASTPSRPVKLLPMPVDEPPSSSDEEDYEPPPRRRFRPVFRDQTQWAHADPRLATLAHAAAEYTKRMIKRYGVPFPDLGDGDVAMDSD